MIGNYVKRFMDGNTAITEGIHLNSDYPHKRFTIIHVDKANNRVVLRSHYLGSENKFDLKIKFFGNGQEYVEISQSSSFEKLFGEQPKRFKIFPFNNKENL